VTPDLDRRLAQISPERRRLFELLKRQRGVPDGRPGVPGAAAGKEEEAAAKAVAAEPFGLISEADRERLPADVEDAYPLSMMQAGMIFHMELSAGYLLYQNVDSWHLRTPWDHQLFERAVQHSVARHEVLRTSFDLQSYSEPLQLVHREAFLPVGVEDLRELAPERQRQVIHDFVEEEKRRPIDRSRPPLLRFTVHRLMPDELQFTLTEFHPILDGWSLQLTLAEILACYSALLSGAAPPPAAPLATRFREFVRLEREALASEPCKRYWQETMAGFRALEIPRWPPGFRSRPGRPVRAAYIAVRDEVFAGLKRLAESERLPLKSLLLAAHLELLARLSGQSDVLTAIISHGRPEQVDGDRVRGLFLNSVPFRLRLAAGSWLDLARAAFAKEQELLPYSRYPLAAIQHDLGTARLVETAFNVTHFHLYRAMPRLTTAVENLEGGHEREENSFVLEVTFNIDAASTRLQMVLMYHPAEIAPPQANAMGGYLGEILAAVAAAPAQQREAAVLLPPGERHLALEWNDTAAPSPAASFSKQFQEQARRTPDRVAVELRGVQLTYGELDGAADALAAALAARGIGVESIVGLLAARGPELLVAVLGVLAAGAAYLPLDPLWPVARLAQVLEQSGSTLLLADDERHAVAWQALAAIPAARRPRLQSPAALMAAAPRPGTAPASPGLEALAYVIYTSGSTGAPRGVMVHQRGMLNHLRAKIAALALRGTDCIAQTAAMTFDVSVWQLLAALLVGGRVLILDEAVAHDPALLLDSIERGAVSILEIVPALFQMVLEELQPAAAARHTLASLRWLLLTGEALPPQLARDWLQLYPGIPLLNAYGPTECSDDVSHRPLSLPPAPGETLTPIGRPLANTRLHVLGRWLQPLPIGTPGQLFAAGLGVGRGYLAEPARTAAAFLPDPCATQPGARLYATGDLARFRPDGNLDFLGRIDFQVKLRGFRIELGEIESALGEHPGVREAVAVAQPGAAGDSRLVAYVVARPGAEAPGGLAGASGGEPAATAALRAFLADRLPDSMLPAVFVWLERLPRSANGKVDHRALPRPAAAPASGRRPPRDLCELQLARIWEDLLDCGPVAPTDSFFSLGGHSLLAVRLMNRIRTCFGRKLPLSVLFASPTLEALAARVRQAGPPVRRSVLVHLHGRGAGVPLFLVHPGGGNVLCYWQLAHALGSDSPVYGLQLPDLEGAAPSVGRLETLAAHYLEALATVQPLGPCCLGGWSLGGVIAFEMARQLERQGREVPLLALIDSLAPARRPAPPAAGGDLVRLFAEDLAGLLDLSGERAEIQLPAAEPAALRALCDIARAHGHLPHDLDAASVERLFAMFKAGHRALAGYTAEPYQGPVLLFTAGDEAAGRRDPTLGWRDLAPGGLSLCSLPGNHYTIVRSPAVEEIAAALGTRLATIGRRGESLS
jgi:amino acid adenylation domain-containing protein